MISFVVPAHNEQACLPATLAAIHASARATEHILPRTWTARISNAIALLLILVMASGLLGHLVP